MTTSDVEPAPAPLAVENLTKDFGDLLAVDGVSFALAVGTRCALLGTNGAGKSTVLRMIAGLLEPTAGSVLINGHAPGTVEARAATSYVSDNPVLYDDLSVIEHLEYVARLHGVEDWEERAVSLIARFGLTERADDLPALFSRGLRQKTALAIGFVRPFSLLLIDEPFVGLDVRGRGALLETLDELPSHVTALVSTHELSFVDTVQRSIALADGRVVRDGQLTREAVRELLSV